ncbi:pentapeptide repeat-containing protein [Lentzea sp. NPDC055074]
MREQQDRPTYKVLSTRTIVWFGVVLVVVGAGVAAALLLAYGTGTEADKARLDAIKTAGTIVIGTGGAAALWLAARRQQAAEIALRQKDIDQAHQEQDAAERRITELYTKAVEQLGSEKAPVRLGGMYALERLAQNVPDQRQTIVNVLCSYLRMPFQSPADEQAGLTGDRAENERRIQEREVRLTAQRIITKHLHPGGDADHPAEIFWENIDLDLTGATLTELDLENCRVRTADFGEATFEGTASFGGATFEGTAWFGRATFGYARFGEATFERFAGFGSATFEDAWFGGATFEEGVGFDRATFKGSATFGGAMFEDASFDEATFEGGTGFGEATFEGQTSFDRARVRLGVFPEPLRSWPDQFFVTRPDSPQEAVIEGQEGIWGYLVSVRNGSQSGEGDE